MEVLHIICVHTCIIQSVSYIYRGVVASVLKDSLAAMSFCGWTSEHYKDHFEDGKVGDVYLASYITRSCLALDIRY